MCGIIGVVRRRDERPPLLGADVRLLASEISSYLSTDVAFLERLTSASSAAHSLDLSLRSLPGVRCLVADPELVVELGRILDALSVEIEAIDAALDRGDAADRDAEAVNAAMISLKDGVWALRRDRLRNAEAIRHLTSVAASPDAVAIYWQVQVALSALDRLEVRGRDSAGIEIVVRNIDLDAVEPAARFELDRRAADPVFRSGAVRLRPSYAVFVYKTAAEIGELGDNTAVLRSAIVEDAGLRALVSQQDAEATVLGHTRWASIGIISESNAHPLDSDETEDGERPLVTAALNGDVDNFADLKAHHGLLIAAEITTDAKVIPTIVSRGIAGGADAAEAFRAAVASFEGSVAIGATAGGSGQLLLALRGSGQALYIGMADHAYIVASEPYGVVEEATSYLRMDGETPSDPDNSVASRGQVVVVDPELGGDPLGLVRISYDGTALPISEQELVVPEITTRDIDLGDSPHFYLKEISEAPNSFRKTLRGRIIDVDGVLREKLGPDSFPDDIRNALADGTITNVVSIGQGTAAIAGQSLEAFLTPLTAGRLRVESTLATELSGFGVRRDMSDTLVVAVSQSGTTTDTNRTVDVVRARGAKVISIVNRRGSDLTDRSDGVVYTSDGRDVEMSVASTKAFYAQIAAGAILSCAIARAAAGDDSPDKEIAALLEAIRALPDAMATVVADREFIGEVARRHAPSKRYWAIVGNGPNATAAREIRIKLSELCYKAIAQDSTEDKKHIDLSSEPLILICAAGLTGSTADDVAKEIAIFRAHKATPIALVSGDTARFSAAVDLIALPAVDPSVDFVLATVAGHLFGYEAALAIDAQAHVLRQARSAIEVAVDQDRLTSGWDELRDELKEPAARFFDGLRTGAYDGHLEASTAVRISTLWRYASGIVPLEAFQLDFGKVGTPGVVVEDLDRALTAAIDELTRPVDAIKHQAKTVTVGISRSDETLLESELVREVLAAGAPRDRLSYRSLRALAALDTAVVGVTGYTRYRVEGGTTDDALVHVVDSGGIARDLASRTLSNPTLRGTKHRAAFEREVTVSKGRSDGRTIVIVPEVKDTQTTGLTLLHVAMEPRLAAGAMRTVMQGYRGRYAALKDAVTETESTFRDDLLSSVDVIDLLTEPVYVLAEHWKP
ncbi:MAG: SIS domain-containing protein [Actinobacteria bacterium]|nr:SIS domain-containing protein [Actinomycetota bacterium]